MRGPLTSVFQNVGSPPGRPWIALIRLQAALMIFVLDTTIGLAVWLPFTIGKTISLLLVCSNPRIRYCRAEYLPAGTYANHTSYPVADPSYPICHRSFRGPAEIHVVPWYTADH